MYSIFIYFLQCKLIISIVLAETDKFLNRYSDDNFIASEKKESLSTKHFIYL